MSSRTSSGLLLPVIVVVGLVAVFGGSKVVDVVEGIVDSNDTIVLGEGDAQVMVAGDAEAKIKRCTPVQLINDRRCGPLKVVVINARRMPFIARNIHAKAGIQQGEEFLVVISNPSKIADRPFARQDVAEDQSACES